MPPRGWEPRTGPVPPRGAPARSGCLAASMTRVIAASVSASSFLDTGLRSTRGDATALGWIERQAGLARDGRSQAGARVGEHERARSAVRPRSPFVSVVPGAPLEPVSNKSKRSYEMEREQL